jgi:hypothetical protein
MPIAHIVATIVLLLNFVGPCWAGALGDAAAAYDRGDYATELPDRRTARDEGSDLARSVPAVPSESPVRGL